MHMRTKSIKNEKIDVPDYDVGIASHYELMQKDHAQTVEIIVKYD